MAYIQAQAEKACQLPILEHPNDYNMWYCHAILITNLHLEELCRTRLTADKQRMLIIYTSVTPAIRRLAAEHLVQAIAADCWEPRDLYDAIKNACEELNELERQAKAHEQFEEQAGEKSTTKARKRGEKEEDEEEEEDKFYDAVEYQEDEEKDIFFDAVEYQEDEEEDREDIFYDAVEYQEDNNELGDYIVV